MAETERNNLPVAEEPEFTTEIPAIRPDDPVHFAQMNAMLESLLGNDVFLKRLANKMIENSLIAHVLDCENPQMVLGADQGPAITGLIDGVKEDVTQLYSEITPIIKTKNDGILTYLVSGMEYTNCIFVKYGPIIFVKLHGTCPYQLGENTYAKITDPAFIPIREITAVAAFASGTAKNGTGILKIRPDGSINIVATESDLNWIFADIFYCVM